jgi:poly(3-hydroxybutyrate) depolymerase
MLRCALATVFALLLVVTTMPARTALAPVARAAELPAAIPNLFIHVPPDLPRGEPLQALVALHGMGGNGEQFASGLIADADRNHWLLIAPTINYGDWTDPDEIAGEDPRLIKWLADYIDHLSEYSGLAVKPRVLLIGHSRGAQLAHRFALFEPERVLAVAALAAGTYTLPVERSAGGTTLRFPFGLGDLFAIAGHPFSRMELIEDTDFWLGVGTEDKNPADLPRAWDAYIGATRVDRANAFQSALHTLGARSVLVGFNGVRHTLTPDMTESACSFLRALDLAHPGPDQSEAPPTVVHATHVRPHF